MTDDLPIESLGEDLATRLRRFAEVRDHRDETKAAAEAAEREYRHMEADVWEALEASPLDPPYRVDGIRFEPVETYYGRVVDEDAALEYFETRALSDEFTKPGIRKGRVNELVREFIEQGKPPPEGLDFYARRYVKITRPKH